LIKNLEYIPSIVYYEKNLKPFIIDVSFHIWIYGERSPNLNTIVRASGKAPMWLFMPDDVAEHYEASCLENEMQLLEGCVKAFKRNDRESQIS
jgi:hypothetical protein